MPDRQRINGNNNMLAGRDLNVTNYFTEYRTNALHFYEQDIKNVIETFSEYFHDNDNHRPTGGDIAPFDYVEKEEKNKLNSLSDSYFDYIKSVHLPYFYKIDNFLKDPKNSLLLEKYEETAFEINFIIETTRSHYSSFDEVLGAIYDGLTSENIPEIQINRKLYIVFINYMYWNCDIGRKS